MSELSEFDTWYAKELFGDDSAKFKYIKSAYHNLTQLARAVIEAHKSPLNATCSQCPREEEEKCTDEQCEELNPCTCPDCMLAREVLGDK